MSNPRTKIIFPLLVVFGLILVYMLQNPYHREIESLTDGRAAPDFVLNDLQGKEVRLSDYRGKLVFLNFWATWCPPCREEMPSMESLYSRFKDRPFQMLTVSIDDDPEQVERFRKAFGYTFPMLFDQDKRVASLYQTTGVPETFLIGPDGTIIYKVIGPYDWENPDTLESIQKILPVNEGTL